MGDRIPLEPRQVACWQPTPALPEQLLDPQTQAQATCIGCDCDDAHACVDELGCSWLVVDREQGRGVCSQCPEHMERWQDA